MTDQLDIANQAAAADEAIRAVLHHSFDGMTAPTARRVFGATKPLAWNLADLYRRLADQLERQLNAGLVYHEAGIEPTGTVTKAATELRVLADAIEHTTSIADKAWEGLWPLGYSDPPDTADTPGPAEDGGLR